MFFYGGIKFALRFGELNASNGERSFRDINVHERIGYTFELCNPDNLITPFVGFGYRQFKHDLRPNGMSRLTLIYNEFYVPLGVLSQFKVMSYLSIGLSVTWMPQVFSTVKINPLGGAQWILQKRVKNAFVELPFRFLLDKYAKNLSIIASPSFEVWQDGASTARVLSGTALALPQNTYIFWGANLELRYAF